MLQQPICPTARKKRNTSKIIKLKCRTFRLHKKIITQMYEIHSRYGISLWYTKDYKKLLPIIRKVIIQDNKMFKG